MAALLPEQKNTTATAIFAHYERVQKMSKPRPHLGASIIGKECRRALWYDFRWCTARAFVGRMLRLFDTGNQQENRLVVDLRNAGATVYDKDPATGKQFQYKDIGGHFSGSMDAAVSGLVEAPQTWHVGEFKTHNAKSFSALEKDGVQKSKPLHWHQMNTYAGWTGMKRWFYLAVNKDTDDLHPERGEFDKVVFERDRVKARSVIEAPNPLSKLSDDPEYFECKFCDHHPICHVGQAPVASCRTCVHSTPVVDDSEDGKWRCERYQVDLTTDQQITGCESHLFIPDLIPYGEATDAGDEWILYKHKANGKQFVNCSNVGFPPVTAGQAAPSIYTSKELSGLHPNLVGDAGVDGFRNEFDGGKVVAPQQQLKEMA